MRALLIAFLLAGPAFAEDGATAAPRRVVSETVSALALERVVYVGAVAARAETDLGFPVNGTLAERLVEAGDLVAAGQELARLDPEELDADLRAAEAGVIVAEAQLRSAAQAETRARELSARGVDSATRLEDAERRRIAAEARLEQASAALERARDMLGFATLRAPQDGIITEAFAEPGATLSAGQPALRLAGTDQREVVIDLSEPDVAALDAGAVFDVFLAADPSVRAKASLTRIDPVAERATRTRRLHLTLDAPPSGFRLGALVRVSPSASASPSLSLPYSAVRDPEGSASVWVVDRGDNSVRLTPVKLGARYGDRVRVTAGLSIGDEVVVKGINSLEDGQIVGPGVSQ